jgi:hypothetical protein
VDANIVALELEDAQFIHVVTVDAFARVEDAVVQDEVHGHEQDGYDEHPREEAGGYPHRPP